MCFKIILHSFLGSKELDVITINKLNVLQPTIEDGKEKDQKKLSTFQILSDHR